MANFFSGYYDWMSGFKFKVDKFKKQKNEIKKKHLKVLKFSNLVLIHDHLLRDKFKLVSNHFSFRSFCCFNAPLVREIGTKIQHNSGLAAEAIRSPKERALILNSL